MSGFEDDRQEPDDESELGFLNDGRPTKMHLANAVQVYVHCRRMSYPGSVDTADMNPPVTVREVAEAFRTPAERIAAAVEAHPWLFLSRGGHDHLLDAYVEEDGE